MRYEDYRAKMEVHRKQRERLKGNQEAAHACLESWGILHLCVPKETSVEVEYPCTPKRQKVDLTVFLCN